MAKSTIFSLILVVFLATIYETHSQAFDPSCEASLDMVFLVDNSGSICDPHFEDHGLCVGNNCTCPHWEAVKNFLSLLVDEFTVGAGINDARIALITFGNEADIIFHLNTHSSADEVKEAISHLKYNAYQNTNTQDALFKMRTQVFTWMGNRDYVNDVAIVLTDGHSTNRGATITEARRSLDSGINILAVGVGEDIDREELAAISSYSPVENQNFFMTPDVFALTGIIRDLVTLSCPSDDCIGGAPMDLTFVLDSSGSICDDTNPGSSGCPNYSAMKNFVVEMINRLDISASGSGTRVALIVYGNSASVKFNLNEFGTKAEIQNRVQRIVYLGENTNTADALQLAMDEVYTGQENISGDRPGVTNTLILLTDGQSTVNRGRTVEVANEAKERITIITVGISEHVSEDELRDISSGGRRNVDYFVSATFDDLERLAANLESSACEILGCRKAADVIFLLDASGSIEADNFEIMKQWLTALLDRMEVDSGLTRVGLIVYSDDATVIFQLDAYSNRFDMQLAVENLVYTRGTTNTAAALRTADTMLARDRAIGGDVMKLIVLVTDGASNDKIATSQAASQVKDNGAHVIVIGVSDWIDRYEVFNTASHPYEYNSLFMQDFTQFDTISGQLIEMMCDNVDDCRDVNCENGAECVDLIGTYMCTCADNMGGTTCQYECREDADVVFALDSSFSIGAENYLKMTEFVRDVILDLPMMNQTRVGLMAFADTTKVYFHLNENNGMMSFMNDMSAPYCIMGTTNTALALRTMREVMFTGQNGDRDRVQNTGILITDGRSDNFEEALREAREARKYGIEIITIGINTRDQPLSDDWQSLASWPEDKNVLQTGSFDDLDRLRMPLRDAICNNWDACDSNPCQNFGTCIDMVNAYHCECIRGFTGINCERRCDGMVDLVLVLDYSGSIPIERFREVRNFLSDIVENMEIWQDRVRVAMVTFDDVARIVFDLDEYMGRFQEAAAHIRYGIRFSGGKTNLAEAMEKVREIFTVERGDRPTVPNLVITFTDGGSNIRQQETIPRATDIKIDGARLMTVSVGQDLDMAELMGISSRPANKNFHHIESYRDFNDDFLREIIGGTCDEVDECMSNPCRMGGRCIDQYEMYYCECANDYSGENCDRPCTGMNDVVLLLDISGSLDDIMGPLTHFVEHVVYGLEFQQNRNRLSVVTFSDDATVRFNLMEHTDKRDLLNAIVFMERGGRTNTAAALRVTREQVLVSSNGDREGVDNSVVLFTDGGSNVDTPQTATQARLLKDIPRTDVYVVPVGENVDLAEVNEIASSSSHVLGRQAESDPRLTSFEDITRAANQLLDILCQSDN